MPKNVFSLIALVIVVVFAGGAGWVIWQHSQEVHAPRDPGVCWRMNKAGRFEVLYRGSQGIEACAGDLERVHMKTGETLVGAYQGRYIFVDNEAIRSSDSLTGQRWRLYFDNQRQALDKSLNAHDMVFTTQR